MNYSITIESTFIVAFVATLIIIGFVDVVINLTRFVLKMIKRKRRSGLWDPLGETVGDDDHRDNLTDEEADKVIDEFNERVRRFDKTDPSKVPPPPPEQCKMPPGGAMCRPPKPSAGVDDKPRADLIIERDAATGLLRASKPSDTGTPDPMTS